MVPQVGWDVVLQIPCGSGAPLATEVQRPFEPFRLQAWQAPLHAELQQTPCAQNPDLHSELPLHDDPGGLRPHEPLTQKLPATHCASVLQVPKHTAPLHTYGSQVCDAGVTHWPIELQVAGGVYAPDRQDCGPH